MVKHTVLFKLKEDLDTAVRQSAMETFRQDILALTDIIPVIRHIEVGLNCNPDEQWDICLYSAFDSMEDLQAYATHPQHLAAARKLKPLLAGRACVDYNW